MPSNPKSPKSTPKASKAAAPKKTVMKGAAGSPLSSGQASSSGADNAQTDTLDTILQPFKMASASWQAFQLNFPIFALVWLLPVALGIIAVPYFILPHVAYNEFFSSVVALVSILVIFIVACIFVPAMTVAQLESAKGNKVSFGEVFERSKKIAVPFILLLILLTVVITLGFVLFIIPGLIAIFFLMFSPYVLVDKQLGVVESMQESVRIVKENWPWVAGIFLVEAAISFVGNFTLIGKIVSLGMMLVYFCMPAMVYKKLNK